MCCAAADTKCALSTHAIRRMVLSAARSSATSHAGCDVSADAGCRQKHNPCDRINECNCKRSVRAGGTQDGHHGVDRAEQLHDVRRMAQRSLDHFSLHSTPLHSTPLPTPSPPSQPAPPCTQRVGALWYGLRSGTPARRYTGSQGIYTHTVAYERDPHCPVCSPGVQVAVQQSATLQEVRPTLT